MFFLSPKIQLDRWVCRCVWRASEVLRIQEKHQHTVFEVPAFCIYGCKPCTIFTPLHYVIIYARDILQINIKIPTFKTIIIIINNQNAWY